MHSSQPFSYTHSFDLNGRWVNPSNHRSHPIASSNRNEDVIGGYSTLPTNTRYYSSNQRHHSDRNEYPQPTHMNHFPQPVVSPTAHTQPVVSPTAHTQPVVSPTAHSSSNIHINNPHPGYIPNGGNSPTTNFYTLPAQSSNPSRASSVVFNNPPQPTRGGRSADLKNRRQSLNPNVQISSSQTYLNLQNQLLRSKALFTDRDFPPSDSSLFHKGSDHGSRFSGNIVWKRPKDIFKNPQFFYEGTSREDLDQGVLGDCWFVAAAAVLATSHPEFLVRIMPQNQGFEPEEYTGLFRFHFWWFGKWQEVLIDDYLPTDGYRQIYCSNRENPEEIWPCLLEKAYAKLHGSYQGLEGGNMQNALVDMTGGISETIDLQKKDAIDPELYSLMEKSFNMKTLMGAAIFLPSGYHGSSEVRRANGLYMGHAYSITGFKQIPTGRGTANLLRLRNPWGKREYTGPWSDNSPEMQSLSQQLKEEMEFRNVDDGEFWISFDDFVFNIDQLQLCHLSPDALLSELADNDQKQEWNVTVFHDAWINGVTAGGCGNPPNQTLKWKNPQFYITLEHPDSVLGHGDDCTLIIALMQKTGNKKPFAIGFDVYKLKDPSLKPIDGSSAPRGSLELTEMSGTYVYNREVTKRFELPKGTYAIMPSTFNPHEEGQFLLRLVTEWHADSGVLDETVTPTPKTPVTPTFKHQDNVEEIFARHAASDKRLNAHELREFLLDISATDLQDPLKFSLESCRSIVCLMDENKSGSLNLEETRRAWKEIKAYRAVFKQFDADNSNMLVTYELGNVFSKLGFPVSKAVITAIVRRYGDRNNNISLTDFIMLICKMTKLYASFHSQQRVRQTQKGLAEFSMNEYLEATLST